MSWETQELKASDNTSENGIDENQIEKQCKAKRSKELNQEKEKEEEEKTHKRHESYLNGQASERASERERDLKIMWKFHNFIFWQQRPDKSNQEKNVNVTIGHILSREHLL